MAARRCGATLMLGTPAWFALLARLADGAWHCIEDVSANAPEWEKLREYGLDIRHDPPDGWRLARPVELLDAARLTAEFSPAQRRALKLDIFPVLDSTNRYLLAQPGNQPAVCLAEYQSAGRGQRGKTWLSPFAGGLCLSLCRDYPHPPPPALNLALAISALQVLTGFGATELGLKWPNDMLWRGRDKLAGLLLETRLIPGGACRVVAGLGLNLDTPALQPGQPWTDMRRVLGRTVARNALAGRLISALDNTLADYPQQGFGPFLADWQRLDVLAGQGVTLQTPQGAVRGMMRGVDGDGALLLEEDGGLRRYYSGELRKTRSAG